MPAKPLIIATALLLAAPASMAQAQTTATDENAMVACPNQGELEQSINSQGSITAEECTTLQVNTLSSDSGTLCLIDFGTDESFLGRLRDAAFPTQWWVQCEELAAAIQPQ